MRVTFEEAWFCEAEEVFLLEADLNNVERRYATVIFSCAAVLEVLVAFNLFKKVCPPINTGKA